METAHQVWSADSGYPGDPDYREFYRDLAYDLDYDYIKPYLHSDGERRNIGIKYHRITGKVALHEKQPYNPEWAENKAKMHAQNFVFNRKNQIDYLSGILGREPIVVSMYDAELFGHWWFEGPQFINHLFRAVNKQKIFAPITPVEYLEKFKTNQVATPSPSSWGDKGYFEVWLNSKNDWIYKHLHVIADRMVEIASANRTAAGLELRLLNQAARELLLAQSSDWAFIMTTGTMVEYAEKRTKEHIYNFNTLYDQIKNNGIDEGFLSNLEYTNNIFPDIDYTVYIK
jgi:1,4-alpha-glucan branching enzyme